MRHVLVVGLQAQQLIMKMIDTAAFWPDFVVIITVYARESGAVSINVSVDPCDDLRGSF